MSVPAIDRNAYEKLHYTYIEPYTLIRTFNSGTVHDESGMNHLWSGFSSVSPAIKVKRTELAPGVFWRPPTNFFRHVCVFGRKKGNIVYGDGESLRELTGVAGLGDEMVYTNVHDWRGPIWGAAMAKAQPLENSVRRADTQALKKLATRKVNYAVALAEAKKTHEMLAQNYNVLVNSLKAVARKDWSALAKSLGLRVKDLRRGKTLANRHLEFQYGWLPLMGDLHGTLETLREQIQRPLILRATSHVVDEVTLGKSNVSTSGTLLSAQGKCRRDHSTTLYAKIDDRYLQMAQRVGLTDPLTLGWELIPYSFIVDWALPIGTMLEALSATHGLTFMGGYRALHGTLDLTVSVYWDEVAHHRPFYRSTPEGRFRSFSYSRSTLSDFPEVVPYFKSPFSAQHAVNAAALLQPLLNKKK